MNKWLLRGVSMAVISPAFLVLHSLGIGFLDWRFYVIYILIGLSAVLWKASYDHN